MLGLISSGIATTAFIAGAGVGLGLAGLAATACRYRQHRARTDGGRP